MMICVFDFIICRHDSCVITPITEGTEDEDGDPSLLRGQWLCVVVYGHLCCCMELCGSVCGSVWWCLAIFVAAWDYVGPVFGRVCQFVAVYDNVWQSLAGYSSV